MTGRWARWLLSFAHRRPLAHPRRLTIVRHHRVYAESERPLYRLGVSEYVFEQQLALLHRRGLAPVTVAEGLAWLASGASGHRVAMSFDDGYADNVERALPLLRDAGGRATFYLTAGLIEERRAPWWDVVADRLERTRADRMEWSVEGGARTLDLSSRTARSRALGCIASTLRVDPEAQREALALLSERLDVRDPAPCALATWPQCRALVDAGMEVGAHTLSHPFLSRLDAVRQREEVGGSIERIADRLGVRPEGIAYPGGDHDDRTVRVCADLGLRYAVTTHAGDNAPDADRFRLRRRGWSDGACLGPDGRFSRRLAMAELDGAFDGMRRVGAEA